MHLIDGLPKESSKELKVGEVVRVDVAGCRREEPALTVGL